MKAQAPLQMPPGACDCHTHVIGPRGAHPMVADRHYTPGEASHEALLAHLTRHALERVVIVQPSVYGTDNRCMLDSLDRLDGMGRGVAVLDDAVDAAGLKALHRRGVRALRVNVESAGLRDTAIVQAALDRWAGRIEMLGWHLQLYAAPDTIAGLAEHLAQMPVAVVLDHFAMVPASLPLDDPRAAALLGLLRSGNAYVKLSAPYRLGAAGSTADTDVGALAGAFLAVAPERVLWGSDWPHTDREPGKAAHEVSRYRTLPQGTLERGIATWMPTHQVRRQVLADNPARLYRF